MRGLKLCIAVGLILAVSGIAGAATWRAWGVHGGSISSPEPGVIDAYVYDTDGQTPDYHWNKSSWTTRTGQKAFFSTDAFNGMTLDQAIQSISYTVDTDVSTYWGNAYWNIMMEDGEGLKAILSPAYNSATSAGFATDGSAGPSGDFCIFEAEAGFGNNMAVGWYAAEWDAVKGFTVGNGPFCEFPDTLGGTATHQDDPVYSVANWAAWADQSAGSDAGWEQDGVLFAFGQSTGTAPGRINIYDVSVNGSPPEVIPEPFSVATLFMAVGGLGMYYRKKRRMG